MSLYTTESVTERGSKDYRCWCARTHILWPKNSTTFSLCFAFFYNSLSLSFCLTHLAMSNYRTTLPHHTITQLMMKRKRAIYSNLSPFQYMRMSVCVCKLWLQIIKTNVTEAPNCTSHAHRLIIIETVMTSNVNGEDKRKRERRLQGAIFHLSTW